MTKKVPSEIMDEILWYQENSERLAAEETVDDAESRKRVETTTMSFRLPKTEAERITRIAQERGWSISVLIRSWIQAASSQETNKPVADAIQDFEKSFATLQRVLRTMN